MILNAAGNAADIYDLANKITSIRKTLQAKDCYNLTELKDELDRSEIEDDGLESLRTIALRILIENYPAIGGND